jgi:kynurenine formamidase
MATHDLHYGALPHPGVTPELRALIRTGRVFSLQQVMRPEMPQWAVQPAYCLTNVLPHDQSGSSLRRPVTGSFERIEHSGHSGTHMDALCHIGCWHDNQAWLHGQVPVRSVESEAGFQALGAELIPPIFLRGVLLDVPAALGVECVTDLYEITVADLQRCEARQNAALTPGCAVLIRTGFDRYWNDSAHYMAKGAGPGIEAARYLADRGAVLAGSDTANFEVLAFPDLPVHMLLLYERGIPIVENLRLAELAASGSSEFLFIALPIAYAGATGTSVHPVAIT